MSPRARYAVLGVLVAVLAGVFVWRYGDTTSAVDPDTAEGQQIVTGWHRVDDVPLAAVSRSLPGIDGAADGIPPRGTYLVNLWASYCGPCKHEMPLLERLDRSGTVDVIGVTRDNIERYAVRAMRRTNVTYPNVRDELGDFSASLGDVVPVVALPSSLIVVDGRITWAHIGTFRTYAELRDAVAERV